MIDTAAAQFTVAETAAQQQQPNRCIALILVSVVDINTAGCTPIYVRLSDASGSTVCDAELAY